MAFEIVQTGALGPLFLVYAVAFGVRISRLFLANSKLLNSNSCLDMFYGPLCTICS